MQEKDKCQILEKAEPAITGTIIYYIDTLIGILDFCIFLVCQSHLSQS